MLAFVLPDSRPPLATMLQSTFLHVALVAGATWGTRSVIEVATGRPPIDVGLTWPSPPTRTAPPIDHTDHGEGLVPSTFFCAFPLPEVPQIDPADLGRLRPDPRSLLMTLLPGSDTTDHTQVASAATYLESEVDDVPVIRSAPALRYPRVMAEAGIEGSVTLSFVIDAEGRVVAGSAKVVRSSHEAFVAAAEEAVYGSRFTPAKRRGEAVPVLVRQTVSFRQ